MPCLFDTDIVNVSFLVAKLLILLESVEKNISEMIFKLAVQSAIANIFIASGLNLNTSNIDYLTKCAAREIAKQNGIIDLKKASEMFGVE